MKDLPPFSCSEFHPKGGKDSFPAPRASLLGATTPAEVRPARSLIRWGILLVGLMVSSSEGAEYQIDWYTIDGGGTWSQAGALTLQGTLGQPDAGVALASATTFVWGGFWAMEPVPGLGTIPRLEVTSEATSVLVSWDGASLGFRLEHTTSLAPSLLGPDWVEVPGAPYQTTDSKQFVRFSPLSGPHFFRLHKP